MEQFEHRASLSRSKGRKSWCVIFKHPLRTTTSGRPGLRVRRGLGTTDENEAQGLVDQLNEIIDNKSMWTPAAKETAERKYDNRIVAAFFDKLIPGIHDSRIIRDQILPLPSKEDEYLRILFLGTTGSGKTTVLRQLIGTHPTKERFPSISPAKTTVSDTEIFTTPGPFVSVITFLQKDTVRHYIEECIMTAVMEHVNGEPTIKVAKRFLEHTDQRFRLSYLLGSIQILSQDETDDELSDDMEEEKEEGNGELFLSEDAIGKLSENLQSYISRIQILAVSSKKKLIQDLNVAEEEATKAWDDFQELLEYQILEQEEFHQLVDDIIDDVEYKFKHIEKGTLTFGPDDWPSHWFFESEDREEFIRAVNRFSSNYAPNFGRLLTPLVDGMRVSGPFKPIWWEGQEYPKVVLLDGEGLGHTYESVSSISTTATKRYDESDVILLVDNAAQPMQAPPITVLKSLVSSGHESKLVIAFTHFDELKGDNLPDTSAKKSHVLYSLDGAIAGVTKRLGRSAEMALKKATSDRVFFLSNTQKRLSPKARLTISEFKKLIACTERVGNPEWAEEATPIYDIANLVLCIQKATQDFHHPWMARIGLKSNHNVKKEHWARIKALTRRLGVLGKNEYQELMPVADLITSLSEHLSMFLSEPIKWRPSNPDEDSKREAIDRVEREVFKLLHVFSSDRLFLNKVKEWSHAYSAHRGHGSTINRAQDIRNIYERAAPIPGEIPSRDASEFLSEVRRLVKDAIKNGGGGMMVEG